jgi:curved DNA-binding protein CbpA
MKYHPDRLARQNASPEETKQAADKFAAVAGAYQLLSDPQRKQAYDHVFKYGGYDDDPPQPQVSQRNSASRAEDNTYTPFAKTKEPSRGIGYVVRNPFSALFCQQDQMAAVAGVQIPPRMHLSHPPAGGGIRFAFSSGQFATMDNGSKKIVSKTTQFVQGKKYSRVETTTLHPDGRKELVIEGNDYVERHVSSSNKRKKSFSASGRKNLVKEDVAPKEEQPPWYICAWHQMREKLSMCHNPCGTILAQ